MIIKQALEQAYRQPDKKFCYYTGKNDQRVAKALNIKQWDWTPCPTVNVEPWYWNTHTLALAFGCQQVFTSEGKEWIAPLITDPLQVNNIKMPNVWQGRTGEILRKMQDLSRKLPEDTLIRLPDVQSPLGVAELIWDQSFYMALLTDPDAIHQLLEAITEFTITYVKIIREILGTRYNPATHPQVWSDNRGYYISDDVNSMVSPEMHMEYSIRYINKLTQALGPVHYHSCTWTTQYLDNIEQVANPKAINWSIGTSADPATIIDRFSGKVLLMPHISIDNHTEEGVTNLNKGIESPLDLVSYFLDNMKDNSTLYLYFHDNLVEDVDMMVKIYQRLKEAGYAPQ